MVHLGGTPKVDFLGTCFLSRFLLAYEIFKGFSGIFLGVL